MKLGTPEIRRLQNTNTLRKSKRLADMEIKRSKEYEKHQKTRKPEVQRTKKKNKKPEGQKIKNSEDLKNNNQEKKVDKTITRQEDYKT